MLSPEKNKILTQVGRGTPMGELMRRYWHPIAAVTELDELRIKPVRLLGEDLVLYQAQEGGYGLIERHCPHRGADLSYGTIEPHGLRCAYHGWCFDRSGACVEMPFEETVRPDGTFKSKVKAQAYLAEARAGLIWAYMGPLPAPLVPNWEPYTWKNVFRQIVLAEVPCNWFQCQENSIDPVHFEWLHERYTARLTDDGAGERTAWARRSALGGGSHLKIAFEEFEYGLLYKRVLQGGSESSPLWTVGRACLWPNAFLTKRIEWRVPIDDTTTLSVSLHPTRVPNEQEPYEQKRIPYWYGATVDPVTKRWIMSHNMNQDLAIWVGQGTIADRSRAHLGESDRGIIMLRKKMFEQAEIVASGGEPMGLVRDKAKNEAGIYLPCVVRDEMLKGYPQSQLGWKGEPPDFPEFAGQPAHVRKEYLDAMGWRGNL